MRKLAEREGSHRRHSFCGERSQILEILAIARRRVCGVRSGSGRQNGSLPAGVRRATPDEPSLFEHVLPQAAGSQPSVAPSLASREMNYAQARIQVDGRRAWAE
jgi:hypothetical protein